MENPAFKDVFPIEDADVPLSWLVFRWVPLISWWIFHKGDLQRYLKCIESLARISWSEMSEWKKHVDKHETRFKPTIYGTHPKIDSLNLKMMGLEDDFPDIQGARILRFQPFIFRSVYTRKTGICYISLPSTSEKGSWIYLILSGPLGVIFIKTTPRFMGRFCCTPCKRVSFFLGGVRKKAPWLFWTAISPPKKNISFFSNSSFFNYNLPWPTDPLACSHRWLHHFSWCLT